MKTRTFINGTMILGALSLALVGACGDDDPMMTGTDSGTDAGTGADTSTGVDATQGTDGGTEYTMANLTASGLEPLGGGFMYEGWFILDGAPISSGKFNIDASGAFVDADGIAIGTEFDLRRDVSGSSGFVLTIEPVDDPDIAPAEAKFLSGPLDGTTAVATLSGGPQSFPTDFSESTGSFILTTPTTETMDDELSGIWFVDFPNRPASSLALPELPAGWVYEGWVVFGTADAPMPVSTGRFTDLMAQDDFNGFSGDFAAGPPVPGEDFVVNAPEGLAFPTELRGRRVVISVEPAMDDSPGPFVIKPLVGTVADDAANLVNLDLGFNAQTLSITATLRP